MSTSIELFHLYYKDFSIYSQVSRDMLLYELQRAAEQAMENEWGSVKMVLLDDQPISKRDRAEFFAPIIAQLAGIGIDYVTFELDLNRAKADWLVLQSNASELSRNIKKVYNGNLQCSHYIAIWYLMRLGLVPDYGCFLPVSWRAIQGQIKPVQLHLLNILPEKYRSVEELTANEILKFNQHADILERSIERCYYGT